MTSILLYIIPLIIIGSSCDFLYAGFNTCAASGNVLVHSGDRSEMGADKNISSGRTSGDRCGNTAS